MSATTESSRGPDGPTSWRAGLRKAGSSSAVPETVVSSSVTCTSDSDKLARSASSSWLASDKGDVPMRRQHSTGITDSYETRNRFNDFYTRYSSLLSSNRSNTSSSATSLTPSTAASTRPASEQPYVPLSRRRQLEREQKERERMLGLSSIVTTTRLYEAPKRDEEKEIERKAKARKARSTRRSTQGVTKEDIERAELALQAANKGIDLAAVSANKRSSENKENKPERTTEDSVLRKVWTDEDTQASLRKLKGAGDSTRAAIETVTGLTGGVRGSSSVSSTVPSITTTDTTTPAPSSAFRSSYRSKYLSGDSERKTDEGTRDELKKQGSKEG
ncbi:hypothetical protein NP493_884g04028 [Ridgeia piscesae]|uniref:Uncharacterized protein n=1 Tax=Ridgeia piscesae TaxID=27915 RepID=A0AAD9NLU8_RIDPI|nr:hypothetical protein NP493_884g04028 [Ridgeia piscesae]